ncbi:Holliday junction branch migration protein RuvA [Candidatus Gracilibacteria bacterium]|nr:Holliday junction branch migration protein RuvA [Candidatus Gracilibacteria bacterium]NUJ98567.1 Holliday junction branch migration protein RuvA [Candidatus Gracilibacteria bacterium]
MIAYLEGEIIDLSFHSLIIKTNSGIGYEININEFTFSQLSFGERSSFFIYHSISEGRESLYAFLEKEERQIFTEIIKISGIGGRMGLNLLNFGYEKLMEALQKGDKSFFENVKGIGKKLAEKILIEMKDKDFVKMHFSGEKGNISEERANIIETNELGEEIKKSLVGLGYKEGDVERELKNLPLGYESLEMILPYIIKKLS